MIITKYRKEKGHSLAHLAKLMGVSKTHIWELEKRISSNPTLVLAMKLAHYCNVTIDDLANDILGGVR